MAARLRGARTAAVGLTAAALLVGEVSERYDDAHRVAYVAQNLRRRLRTDPAAAQQETQEAKATAWLAKEPPKFPYLLDISPGDNPATVAAAALDASGGAAERNRQPLEGAQGVAARRSAGRIRPAAQVCATASCHLWKNVRSDVKRCRPCIHGSSLRVALDEVAAALGELQRDSSEASGVSADAPPLEQQQGAFVVFFLRDADDFSDSDAELWMDWIHAVTSTGLAHVVLPTTAGVTPSKLDTLQARHNGNRNSSDKGDFVAILLRVAKGAVDTSSAHEKLRRLDANYALGLRFHDSRDDELQPRDTEQQDEARAPNQNSNVDADDEETRAILDAAGNWWSDLAAICAQLQQRGLAAIADPADRVAVVRQVCEEYHQHVMASILEQLRLDGSLNLLEIVTSQADSATADSASSRHEHTQESLALRALESWKCLEVVTGMAAAQQGLTSPQQFLTKENDKPAHCVHPVEALLPFQQRSEGEAKFLQLLDESILYLRPKSDVEIGVVPCAAASLIAPCWIETRPSIVRAFKKIWLREEIALYAQEIDERRAFLNEQRMDFVLMQFKLTPAERATQKAELSLLELEIQSKDIYLDRLRSMLAA